MVPQSPPTRHGLIPAAALARVPGYSAAARIAALEGGTFNTSFRVDTRAGSFVVRVHDSRGAALGVDHAREARLQTAAAIAGVAPIVVHVDPQGQFMICEYIEGRIWAAEDFADPARLRRLGTALNRLHEITPPIPAPFDLAARLRGFSERIGESRPGAKPLLAQLMAQADVSLRACGSDRRSPVLFHGDLHHSNIIEAGAGLMLIDWEYAAVGDPLFDLACVLAYYPQALPHAALLLEASGLAGRASLSMLEHATWLYILLAYVWSRVSELAPRAGIYLPTPAD